MTRWKSGLFILLACISLVAFLWFEWQDPSMQQDVDAVTSEVAVTRSSQFWQELGVSIEDYEVLVTLDGVNEVDGYLNRYDLYKEYEQKAPVQAPLSFWKVTFYDRDGTNTYITQVGHHSGQIHAYRITGEAVGTDAEGNIESARQAAAVALQKIGVEPGKLLLRSNYDSEESDAKTYVFLRESSGFLVKDLTLHHRIEVVGNQVVNIEYEYLVPDSFRQWRDWQTTIGGLMTFLSMLLSFVLVVVALVYAFLLKGKKPYQSALWLSLLMFVLMLFSNFNQWPLGRQEVLGEGGGSMGVLVVGAFPVVFVVIYSLLMAASTYPMILSGGALVREVKPRLWTSWRDPEWPAVLRRAVWQGYLLAVILLGLQAVFYWLGESYFHVWYEQEFTMASENMLWPLLFPLLAWLAGISEELIYRLFGVTFLKRYLKNSLVAVLLPAMIWALGHSLYPVYPIYTRFVELTIFGVLIGFCYLWFGLETVIFAHVIFDTVLMGIPLFLSGDAVQMSAAVVFLVLPVLVAYALGLFRPRPQRQTIDP